MSGFGILMIIVTIIWSFLTLVKVMTSADLFVFFEDHFVGVFVGYIVIIVLFIVGKAIASSGNRYERR